MDDMEEEEERPSAGAKAVPKPKEGPLKLTSGAVKYAAEEEAVAAPCTSPLKNQMNRKLLVAARLRQSVLHHVVVEAHHVNHDSSSRSTGCRR